METYERVLTRLRDILISVVFLSLVFGLFGLLIVGDFQ
jgi:hypothetical protein